MTTQKGAHVDSKDSFRLSNLIENGIIMLFLLTTEKKPVPSWWGLRFSALAGILDDHYFVFVVNRGYLCALAKDLRIRLY